jgi:hypothetical protein
MNQALYAHMNNKRKMKKKKEALRHLNHHGHLETPGSMSGDHFRIL